MKQSIKKIKSACLKSKTQKPNTPWLRYAGGLFLGACLSFRVFAQDTSAGSPPPEKPANQIITLEEAVRQGIDNNLSLERSRIAMMSKKRVSNLGWNQFLPVVSFGASLGGGFLSTESKTTDRNALGTAIGQNDPMAAIMAMMTPTIDQKTTQWTLGGQGSIGWQGINFALFEGLRKLKLDYESGAVSYDKAKIQLERDIRKAYYNILLMQEQIELLRQSYRNAQRQEDSARANYQGGLAPELYVMQAQVARENLKPSMDQAETGLRLSKASFAMNLGIPIDGDFDLEPISLNTNFVPPGVREMIRKASGNKPDINELKAQITALRSARNALKYNLWTPSLSLSWGLNYGAAHMTTEAGGVTNSGWSDPAWRDTFSLSLSWSLNGILPFTTQFANLHDLDDNIRSLQIGLAQTVQATEIEVYSTISSLEQARVSAEAGRYTVDLAERSYRLTNEAYQAGLQNLLEVQNAELQLRQARTALLQQQVNFLAGLIDLEYAIGVPFGTILFAD